MTALSLTHAVPNTDIRRTTWLGATALALLLGVGGGWATFTQIDGAVVTTGQITAAGQPQIVASLDDGIVRSIEVRNGDTVTAGQVLLRLDRTLVETNLGIARVRLADALALKARLESEQRGLDAPDFRYPDLPFDRPDTSAQEEAQRQIFAARADVRLGARAQLAESIRQSESRITGLQAQIAARRDQAELMEQDLANLRELDSRNLVAGREVNEANRSAASLQGEIESLQADVASTRIGIEDARLATLQDEREFRESIASDLSEASAKVDELVLEIVTRTAELERTVVRSPSDGIVHEMEVATVGGVVGSGATLLQVMPLGQGLDFELRVDPSSIDQVHPGQDAEVVIAPLDPARTPHLKAKVALVPAAAVVDRTTGQSFYRVTLSVGPEEIARLGDGVTLLPGMPVEAFLQTGERSVLDYLLHPVTNHLNRAFRES